MQGEYRLYPISPDNFRAIKDLVNLIRIGELQGLNVTIPYKQVVVRLMDELSPSAQAIGAVNTIFENNGRLVGHNTDASGFKSDLSLFLQRISTLHQSEKESGNKGDYQDALVIGAGGAARAIVYALLMDSWRVTLAVRQLDMKQAVELKVSFRKIKDEDTLRIVPLKSDELMKYKHKSLIINATPVGMFPDIGCSPWPMGCPFPGNSAVYDLVYNPRKTLLLKDAEAAGLQVASGLGMLIEQAALSFACWTGQRVPRSVLESALEEKCLDY